MQLFVPPLLLVTLGTYLYGDAELETERTRIAARESLYVGLGAGVLRGALEDIARDIDFLSSFGNMRRVLDAPSPENRHALQESLTQFSRSKGIYDQLRWLDETGQEQVRVDLRDGRPVVIPDAQLQNKGKRYYFTDSFQLNPREVFVSPLDLNIEKGQIEIPHKPMIRVATPVADASGVKRGVVILNYYGKVMLDAFSKLTEGIGDHVMVVNGEGYWLRGPVRDDEWGFMFKQPDKSLARRAPAAWERIRASDAGQVSLADGLWTWETVYPLESGQHSSTGTAEAYQPSAATLSTGDYVWKSVARVPAETLRELALVVWTKLVLAGGLVLLLIGFGSWKLARAWADQETAEAEVRRVNAELEQLVAERTGELNRKVVELDKVNVELARKNEEMESMIYTASHDLRSPLVNIQGFSQRLEKGMGDLLARLSEADVPEGVLDSLHKLLHERIPTALGFIKSSSLKMDSLINGLLLLSRAGRTQLTIQPVEMDRMMADIVSGLTIQREAASAEVRVGPLPPCLGDQAQLHQVFTNLIDNAIKYRDPRRPLVIEVSGERDGNRVRYVVADTGIGIAPEFQERVWQLFHRLDPAGEVAGEGLGLTMVRRLLERQDGRAWLDSTPGVGTRFTVELPAANPGEVAA